MRFGVIALLSVFAMPAAGASRPRTTSGPRRRPTSAAPRRGGAPSVPDAKLHLQLAQEDLQKSKDAHRQRTTSARRASSRSRASRRSSR